MIALGLIFFVFGVVLAARYQFLVLSVVTLFALIAIACYAHAADLSPMSGILAGLLVAIGLQGGYLSGALALDACVRLAKTTAGVRFAKTTAAVPAHRRGR